MSKYYHHSLALTDQEEEEYKKTGLGVKRIFMDSVKALNKKSSKEQDQQTQTKVEEE